MNFKLFGRFLFSLLLVGLIAIGSQWKVGSQPEHSVLRLSWAHVGAKDSKILSQEELDALPIHMRPQDGVLESETIPYILEVSIDGTELTRKVVTGAGLQEDRPMYIFEDHVLAPGDHTIEITFQPEREIEGVISYRLNESVNFDVGEIRTVGLVRNQSTLSLR